MSWYGVTLFRPELLDDDNISEVVSNLNDMLTDEVGDALGDITVKVVYDDNGTKTYGGLYTGRDEDDDDIASYEYGDREPPTISSKLEIVFDDVTFTLETRQDWLVEWYQADGVVSLTANRPDVGVDGNFLGRKVRQIIISVPRD